MGLFAGGGDIRLLPNGREAELLAAMTYHADDGSVWTAPKGAVVNGASIPRVFWSIIGSPWTGRYRRAAIIHDHYTDARTRSAKRTHAVWCEMLKVDGVGWWQRRLMCAAVKVFAKRWDVKLK